jgi:hypothetical protein
MVVSLLVTAASTVLAAVLGTVMVTQWFTRSDRATTETLGRASPISAIGSDGWTSYVAEVEVVWSDEQGELHRVRFDVVPGSEWSSSSQFRLRYDPSRPDVPAFPAGADAGRVTGVRPPWWGLGLVLPFLVLAAGTALAWRVRIRRAHAAEAGEPQRWRVVPLRKSGTVGATGGSVTIGVATVLVPVSGDGVLPPPPGSLWQPVMWSDGVARLRPGDEVDARVGGGRAVLDTADGHRIWPAGRLRPVGHLPRHQPGAVQTGGGRARPSRWYLIAPLPTVLFGTILPAAWFTVPATVAFCYCLMFVLWSWRGGVPHDL